MLGELVSIGTLIAFIVVCIGVLVLRKTRPDLQRPFRVKDIWLVAPLGIGMCALMIGFLPVEHLDTAGGVDGDRRRDLLRLQLQAQPAAQLKAGSAQWRGFGSASARAPAD